jgi:hypothetical protein
MSGKSNVIYWLEKRGMDATGDRVSRIYEFAKRSPSVLKEHQVMNLLRNDTVGVLHACDGNELSAVGADAGGKA